jgi:hypothetical protein
MFPASPFFSGGFGSMPVKIKGTALGGFGSMPVKISGKKQQFVTSDSNLRRKIDIIWFALNLK